MTDTLYYCSHCLVADEEGPFLELQGRSYCDVCFGMAVDDLLLDAGVCSVCQCHYIDYDCPHGCTHCRCSMCGDARVGIVHPCGCNEWDPLDEPRELKAIYPDPQ